MAASDKAGAKSGARGRRGRQPRQKRNLIGTEDEVSNRQKEEERQNALLRDHVANVRELLQLLDNVRQQAKQLTVAEDVSEDLLHLTRVEVYRLMRSLESENMRLRSLPAAAA